MAPSSSHFSVFFSAPLSFRIFGFEVGSLLQLYRRTAHFCDVCQPSICFFETSAFLIRRPSAVGARLVAGNAFYELLHLDSTLGTSIGQRVVQRRVGCADPFLWRALLNLHLIRHGIVSLVSQHC